VEYFIEIHSLNKLRNFIYSTLGLFRKKYKEKLKEIENDHYRYTNILKMTKSESEYFDKSFNPMVTFSQEKVKLPLTSHYIQALEENVRDIKYGKLLYKGILFAVLLEYTSISIRGL
jgi:hypothetical protein